MVRSKAQLKPRKNLPEQPARLPAGLEEQGTEGGTEGEGVEGRDAHRDGDGQRKLLKDAAADPRDEGHREKDGHEHQG